MIVLIVDDDRVVTIEPERQSPAVVDVYRPMINQRSAKSMQSPAWQSEIFGALGVVEDKELPA
ncbi:hypothetical protein D3C87_1824310 [compost metagenome]